jgi:hypothetical protein
MAKNTAFKQLKCHTVEVELAMKANLNWFATELNIPRPK